MSDGTAPDEEASAPSEPARRRKEWGPRERLRWLKATSGAHATEYWRKKEAETPDPSLFPDDERLDVVALWKVELYTPATLDGLIDGIRDLASGAVDPRKRDETLTWINSVRLGRRAGWRSIGLITSASSEALGRAFTSELPEHVAACIPTLHSVTTSITALVVMFIVDDIGADTLNAPLHATFSATAKPTTSRWGQIRYVVKGGGMIGHELQPRELVRRHAVEAASAGLDARCEDWIRMTIPGFFARGASVPSPGAMLALTKTRRPLTEETSGRAFEASFVQQQDWRAWDTAGWPGFRLVVPDRTGVELSSQLRFAARRRDAFPDERTGAAPSSWTIAQMAAEYVGGLAIKWGLTCMLREHRGVLGELRDARRPWPMRRPVAELKRTRALLEGKTLDMQITAREIGQLASNDAIYRWNVLEPTSVEEYDGERRNLTDELQIGQRAEAAQLVDDLLLVVSAQEAATSATQIISSIRVQRILLLVTVLSVAAAVAAIAISVASQ